MGELCLGRENRVRVWREGDGVGTRKGDEGLGVLLSLVLGYDFGALSEGE